MNRNRRPGRGQISGRLIIVRTGHVIAADGTDQLAAPRLQPLRADGTVPRRIFGTRGGILALLQRRSGLSCGLYRFGLDPGWLPLHGALHGWTVIAQWEVLGNRRSEERRVGKECRSRWSPY